MNHSGSAHRYGDDFFRYQREGSLRSAREVLPLVHRELRPASVLDVGCGAGAWLMAHQELGVTDVGGIDGDYVDPSVLLFDRERFHAKDISRPFDLGRKFDLVQCLEVAEHLPADAGDSLIRNLVRHGQHVLFSAAVPGQGGEDHINEQPYEYWRDKFAARGYELFDFLRPDIQDHRAVEPWYRYNIMLFVHSDAADSLSASVRASRVDAAVPIKDFSPPGHRVRKRLLRLLPTTLITRLASSKARLTARRLARREQA